jgi:hypothetical protein
MRLHLKNDYETNWCLVGDRWSNDENDNVIVVTVTVVSLIVDDHIVQDDASTHDQIENALRVKSIRDD